MEEIFLKWCTCTNNKNAVNKNSRTI